MPILERDVEKTAFQTPGGLFEMVVMPFGLCNSQSTFQRLMDQALRGATNVESFVDDILVFSNSFEEHLIHLEEVFRRLEVAGLQLRKDKCRLAYRGVESLGHWISEDGRSPLKSYTSHRTSKNYRDVWVRVLQKTTFLNINLTWINSCY